MLLDKVNVRDVQHSEGNGALGKAIECESDAVYELNRNDFMVYFYKYNKKPEDNAGFYFKKSCVH
jgi:hypothetical protein